MSSASKSTLPNIMEPPPVKSPSKPPLITPSASPPPKVLPVTMFEAASPYKRQRTFSTPRRDVPSSSRTQTPIDVDKEREASKMRLLDVWSSLAARYTRSLDEDDIVDLHTMKISKDNGVLRNTGKLTFGSMSAPPAHITVPDADDSSHEGDDEDGEEEEDDVYGVDELDAFAESPTSDQVSEVQSKGVYDDDTDNTEPVLPKLPTMPPLGPMDADDLTEFLEAERQRKELCGTDTEDDEDYGINPSFSEDEGSGFESGLHEGVAEDEKNHHFHEDDEDTANQEEEIELHSDKPAEFVGQRLTVTSEDELDDWTVDASSAIHLVKKEEQTRQQAAVEDDSDSDIEFIEIPVLKAETTPFRKSHSQSPRKKVDEKTTPLPPARASLKTAHQLHTPPLSHSSARPSETPVRDKPPSLETKPLFTKVTSPNKKVNDPKHPVPLVDFSRLYKSPVKRTEQKISVSPQNLDDVDRSPSKYARRATPIVLLTPRRGSSQKPSTSLFDDNHSIADTATTDSVKKYTKGKGKAKAVVNSPSKAKETNYHSEEDAGKVQSVSRAKAKKQCHVLSDVDSDDQAFAAASSPSKRASPRISNKEEVDDHAMPAHRLRKPSKKNISQNDISFPSSRGTSPPAADSSLTTRKRKRQSSEVSSVQSDEPNPHKKSGKTSSPKKAHSSNHAPKSRRYIDEDEVLEVRKMRPSSSHRRPRHSHSDSEPESSSNASEVDEPYRRHRSQSRQPHPEGVYTHSYQPIQGFPHIPDPRPHLLISQTMQQLSQQLSALAGTSWALPPHYVNGAGPSTPSHRRLRNQHSTHTFITPTHHHHPYPYSYDPNLSHATLPPDSPEPESSPVKRSSGRRNSLVHRSQSRGRRVSFKLERDHQSSDENEGPSTSPRIRPIKFGPPKRISDKKKSPDKAKRKQASSSRKPDCESEGSESESESGIEQKPRREYKRGQTPGPSFE